jgi:hypothetical protein
MFPVTSALLIRYGGKGRNDSSPSRAVAQKQVTHARRPENARYNRHIQPGLSRACASRGAAFVRRNCRPRTIRKRRRGAALLQAAYFEEKIHSEVEKVEEGSHKRDLSIKTFLTSSTLR